MTGVEASEEMTMEQIEAMSGGELLRNEVNISEQTQKIILSTVF